MGSRYRVCALALVAMTLACNESDVMGDDLGMSDGEHEGPECGPDSPVDAWGGQRPCPVVDECEVSDDCPVGHACLTYDYPLQRRCALPELMDECDIAPIFSPQLVEESVGGAIYGLAFFDQNEDEFADLAVSRPHGLTIYPGFYRAGLGRPAVGDVEPITVDAPDGSPFVAVALGQFDSAAPLDLVGKLADGRIIILLGDEEGGFSVSYDSSTVANTHTDELVTVDWNDDGITDVAGLQRDSQQGPTPLVTLGDGKGGFGPTLMLPESAGANSIANRHYNLDGVDDLWVLGDARVFAYIGNELGVAASPYVRYLDYMGPATLMSSEWEPQRYLTLHDRVFFASVYSTATEGWAVPVRAHTGLQGDFNDDGVGDVVFAGPMKGAVAYGRADCYVPFDLGVPIDHLVVGDHNGNGTTDVAIASGPRLYFEHS